jgi:endonuclease/exonuclease/phosphatase family metal-dependent hydrolase
MKVKTLLSLSLGMFLLSAPTWGQSTPKSEGQSNPPPPLSLTVMSYNVENLFDTEADPGKEDFTFRPRQVKSTKEHEAACKKSSRQESRQRECMELDWSEAHLDEKLKRLAQVILSVNGGKGPDLLLLAEVENIKILERLNKQYLAPAAYQAAVLIEGQDERGIDTAMLSRLPLEGKAQLEEIPFVQSRKKDKDLKTRGLLRARFKLPDGGFLTAFSVHFPAGYHPTLQRQEALETLTESARSAAKTGDLVVAGGDFNINSKEDSRLYRTIAAKDWWISHIDACRTCLGTSYFHRERSWSFLDAIMVWNGGSGGWKPNSEKVRVVQDLEVQKNSYGDPEGFDTKKPRGVSDHFPIQVELEKSLEMAKPKS